MTKKVETVKSPVKTRRTKSGVKAKAETEKVFTNEDLQNVVNEQFKPGTSEPETPTETDFVESSETPTQPDFVESSEKIIQQKDFEISELKAEVDAGRAINQTLKSELSILEKSHRELISKYNVVKNQKDQNDKILVNKKDQIKSLEYQLKLANESRDAFASKNVTLEADITELNTTIENLNIDIDSLKSKLLHKTIGVVILGISLGASILVGIIVSYM